MIGFGDLKNSIEKLRKYLIKMNAFQECNLKSRQIEENNLRANNPQLLLRLINYILIEYSCKLYSSVLQMVPNIKTLNDRKFIDATFLICRKFYEIQPNITTDQFLFVNKFLDKKVMMIAQLAKKIYQEENINVNPDSIKPIQCAQKIQNTHINAYFEQDDDDDLPRQIKVEPTTRINPLNSNNFVEEKVKQEIKGVYLQKQITQGNKNYQKQILNNKRNNIQFSKEKPKFIDTIQENKNHKQVTSYQHQYPQKTTEQEADHSEFVSRQQFNQSLQLLASINSTVNNMVEKFNIFQNSVLGWVNNMNAKVSLIQQDVTMIKNNI